MLMALGLFVFEISTVAFDEMQRRSDWRHAETPRFGAAPAGQYLGPGADDISFSGMLVPEIGNDAGALDTLRAMAAPGEIWPLVDGTGRVLGNYVIVALDTRGKYFVDGGVPRKSDFGLDLKRRD